VGKHQHVQPSSLLQLTKSDKSVIRLLSVEGPVEGLMCRKRATDGHLAVRNDRRRGLGQHVLLFAFLRVNIFCPYLTVTSS
jgi:hypothetical protein